MVSSADHPRWKLALTAGLAGWLVLLATLTLYEYMRFGVQWGFLTGERDLDPVFFSTSLHTSRPYGIGSMMGANAIIAALALPILVGFGAIRGIIGRAALMTAFVLLVLFSGDIMASGYAPQFGATWAEGEAFQELFFRPGLILAIFGPGLLVFSIAIWRR